MTPQEQYALERRFVEPVNYEKAHKQQIDTAARLALNKYQELELVEDPDDVRAIKSGAPGTAYLIIENCILLRRGYGRPRIQNNPLPYDALLGGDSGAPQMSFGGSHNL